MPFWLSVQNLHIFAHRMQSQQNQHTTQEVLSTFTENYPVDDFILEIDPADVTTAMESSTKPQAQSKSKHAFPFGAQISTPRTYCVF